MLLPFAFGALARLLLQFFNVILVVSLLLFNADHVEALLAANCFVELFC